jgi:hypothetical protein
MLLVSSSQLSISSRSTGFYVSPRILAARLSALGLPHLVDVLMPLDSHSSHLRSFLFYSGPGENGTHGFSTLHNPLSSEWRILDNYYKNDVERWRPQPSGRKPLCLFSASPHGTFTDVSCDHVVAGGVLRGTAGRAVSASSGSSSHDLMRHKRAALGLARGLGEGELGGGRTA